MDGHAKRKLENQLMVEGLAGLGTAELVQEFAQLLNNWPGDKHDFLRDALNECDPKERSSMYGSLVPYLRFKPLSLSQYEAQIALKAGAMVSQGRMRVEGSKQHSIEIGGHKVNISDRPADGGWVIVCCHECGKSQGFESDTPVGAVIEARKAGWIWDAGIEKNICPECVEAGCLSSSKIN